MTITALPYVAFTAFLFGSTLVASRFSVGQFDPTTYIAIRLILASIAYFLIYAVTRRRFPMDKKLWLHAGVVGIVGTAINNVAIVASLQYQSTGLTGIFTTTSPAITVMLAYFFLPDERLNVRQWVGVFVALGGAFLLTVAGENGLPDVPADIRGPALALLAMSAGAASTIYARRTLMDYDPFDAASIRILTATVAVVPLAAVLDGFVLSNGDATGALAIVYAAMAGTFGGFLMQLVIITRFGAVPASMPPYLIPIVAGLGGVLLLDETITPLMVLGMAIILVGIALVQTRRQSAS